MGPDPAERVEAMDCASIRNDGRPLLSDVGLLTFLLLVLRRSGILRASGSDDDFEESFLAFFADFFAALFFLIIAFLAGFFLFLDSPRTTHRTQRMRTTTSRTHRNRTNRTECSSSP